VGKVCSYGTAVVQLTMAMVQWGDKKITAIQNSTVPSLKITVTYTVVQYLNKKKKSENCYEPP